jgi:hypothetical protein
MVGKFFHLVLIFIAGNVNAATIYLCENYSGQTFFSNGLCSERMAWIKQAFYVSNAPSFDQQVQEAIQQMQSSATQQQHDQSAISKADACNALHRERLSIESRDTNMQWRPVEAINQDQQRMRGLRAQMSHLGCSMQ